MIQESIICPRCEILVHNEILVRYEILAQNDILVHNDILVQYEILVDNKILARNAILVQREILVHNEILSQHETYLRGAAQSTGTAQLWDQARRTDKSSARYTGMVAAGQM